jgi:hypothetical protein
MGRADVRSALRETGVDSVKEAKVNAAARADCPIESGNIDCLKMFEELEHYRTVPNIQRITKRLPITNI